MYFGASGLLVGVVARSGSALWTGAQRPAVEDGGAGFRASFLCLTQQDAQVSGDRLEAAACAAPATAGRQRGEMDGQKPPASASTDQPAQCVEDLAQVVVALGSGSGHEGGEGSTKAHSSSETSVG